MKLGTPTQGKQGVVMHGCTFSRIGLMHILQRHLPDFTFQASASFGEMARLSTLTQADLVVSDIRDAERNAAYGVDWLEWLQNIRGNQPLVVITEELPRHQLANLSRQSFISVLALQASESLLGQQLQQVLTGTQVISPLLVALTTSSTSSSELYRLTEAELQVIELLHAGYSVTQIASRLCRSVKTVSTHKRHLMHKLQVSNEIELFARVKNLNEKTYCLDNGQQFAKHLRYSSP
ncbi:MAG: helix-turn-helix transcriptional regulator [Enterobacterales bacterium]|uniref:helix-turn-helix transcriptional regulator n=1 Tax=Serratia sp. (in: enterobacteria) TaxID=616 RepID=UPI003F324BF8